MSEYREKEGSLEMIIAHAHRHMSVCERQRSGYSSREMEAHIQKYTHTCSFVYLYAGFTILEGDRGLGLIDGKEDAFITNVLVRDEGDAGANELPWC